MLILTAGLTAEYGLAFQSRPTLFPPANAEEREPATLPWRLGKALYHFQA